MGPPFSKEIVSIYQKLEDIHLSLQQFHFFISYPKHTCTHTKRYANILYFHFIGDVLIRKENGREINQETYMHSLGTQTIVWSKPGGAGQSGGGQQENKKQRGHL